MRTAAVTLRPSRSSYADDRFLMFVLEEMAEGLERQGHEVIRLTLGKVEEPPCAEVVAAMVDAVTDFTKSSLVYPAGLPQLRERLAREYRTRCGVAVDASRFVVGPGTSTTFRNLVAILAGPGDEVLVPLPYYPLYPFTAGLAGATVRHYRIDLGRLAIDLDSLAAAMTDRTRIVVINSPGNPLGNVISPEQFRGIDRVVDGRAVLVSDEIYADMYFDDEPFGSAALTGLRSPLVVMGGFSKGHRMYARRVGYLLAPPDLVEPLTVIQHHTLLTTDPVAQFGAIAALDHQQGLAELAERYRGRRDRTVAAFADVPGVTALPSRGGFYLSLDCARYMAEHGIGDSLELATRVLRATSVATVPGSDFGLPEMLRLSYTSARYDEGIKRLADFFRRPAPTSSAGSHDAHRQG